MLPAEALTHESSELTGAFGVDDGSRLVLDGEAVVLEAGGHLDVLGDDVRGEGAHFAEHRIAVGRCGATDDVDGTEQ